MKEELRVEVKELEAVMEDVVEKLARAVRIANEMYFLRGLMNEVFQKVMEVRGRVKRIREVLDEGQAS
jgi:hypothetical protein